MRRQLCTVKDAYINAGEFDKIRELTEEAVNGKNKQKRGRRIMKNYTDLTGKNAIVTGAAQGLSLGMAEGLMRAGLKVCIIDVNPKAEEVAKEKCAQGYDCHAVIANLTEGRGPEEKSARL